MKKIASYTIAADIIRVLSVICVVIIHTANAVYARPDYFGGLSWWIALVLGSFARVAIPLFVMLSGYLLLQKEESFGKSVQRALQRIGIPLMFWTTFYVWWGNGKPAFTNIDISIFNRFLTINVFHLYFLYIVLGLYIAAPFLRGFLEKNTLAVQKNVSIFFLLLGMIHVGIQYLFQRCGTSDAFTFWIPYIGIFLAGYVLPKLHTVKQNIYLIGMYSVGFISTIFFDYYFYFQKLHGVNFFNPPGCISYYFDYYLSINVVLMSVVLFLLLMQIKYTFIKNDLLKNGIYSIARASFGIFILHIFFLTLIDTYLVFLSHMTVLWLALLIRISLVFITSYIATFVLVKIPVINRLFGEK